MMYGDGRSAPADVGTGEQRSERPRSQDFYAPTNNSG